MWNREQRARQSPSQIQSLLQGLDPSLAFSDPNPSSESEAKVADSLLNGTLNDESMVRAVVTASIKRSGKSREQIADEMTGLLGIAVTARMITAFTAECKELHRWPGGWDRAFCAATGDNRLLTCRVEAAGFRVITAEEEKLLELGRAYLRRKRAEKSMSAIEQDFDGVDL
jgi:hypothetical protein